MNFDTSCFKAFQSAAKTLNFTEAARLAGMTQSGVSQHISKLENEIGSALFHRIGKRVLLTESGLKLLEFIDQYQDSILAFQAQLQNSKKTLSGKVSYAMPESCLLGPHFSMLLKEKFKSFQDVELGVELMPSDQVLEKVLNNQIDFGFVTKKLANDNLQFIEFCDEEYVLVSSSAENSELRWINYPGHDVLFEIWSAIHKYNKTPKFQGTTNSLRAALQMVTYGLGVAIFPAHCVDGSEHKSKLKILTHNKKCKNTIYIVKLASISTSARVQKVIETFLGMK